MSHDIQLCRGAVGKADRVSIEGDNLSPIELPSLELCIRFLSLSPFAQIIGSHDRRSLWRCRFLPCHAGIPLPSTETISGVTPVTSWTGAVTTAGSPTTTM